MGNEYLDISEQVDLDVLKREIKEDIALYEKKAKRNGTAYKTLSIIAFIFPLMVPLASQISHSRVEDSFQIIASALAISASIILGISARLNLHKNWLNYGEVAFNLSYELSKHESNSGDYRSINDREKFLRLKAFYMTAKLEQFDRWKIAAKELAELTNKAEEESIV